ncbi:MAG TPA: class I SAM-dependent rRNA methyltransferase [Candidatus Hydrogenedentes bacterium]|nr:class I SAM-dependent rRNA methyltransferase [Candidatus Hydrogenedentota bacterium]
MYKATLNPKEERRMLRGHLWAYRNEFSDLPDAEDGALVDVASSVGRFVGRGFYQKEGGIAVRLLSSHEEPIDGAFIGRRILRAKRYREILYPGETTYRWLFGESDGLPGLVADRYGSVVVAESHCAFYAPHTEAIANAFLSDESVTGVRVFAGGRVSRFGDAPIWNTVEASGVTFKVNIDEGQKTGLFLDQRENCLAAAPFFRGARVFDGFCYAGQWGLHAARAGASSVLAVDSSKSAIELAKTNAVLNGVEGACAFECADVSEALDRGGRYDVVVLDPPALAKSRSFAQRALGHYQNLNQLGMQSVEPGGYLITSSCSHFVDQEAFLEMLKRAARTVQRAVWLVDVRGPSRDHPILLGMPETAYLKCVTLRVF